MPISIRIATVSNTSSILDIQIKGSIGFIIVEGI